MTRSWPSSGRSPYGRCTDRHRVAIPHADLSFLLADFWERPAAPPRHVRAWAVPSVDQMAIEERSRAAPRRANQRDRTRGDRDRRRDPQGPRPIDRGVDDLSRSLAAAIANATFNGPARVREAWDGKTVVALHRVRVLAVRRVEGPDKVLLTTFLNTLPKVRTSAWAGLTRLRFSGSRSEISTRSPESSLPLMHEVWPAISERPPGKKDCRGLVGATRTRQGDGPQPQLLLDEFDAFIAGRGVETPTITLRRVVAAEERPRPRRSRAGVRSVDRVRSELLKRKAYDWPHTAQGARLAEAGAGPRYTESSSTRPRI